MPKVNHTPKEKQSPKEESKEREDDPKQLLIHQRQQVQSKVSAISRALEEAEDNPKKVSASLLKVFSKKLDLHYNEFVSIHQAIVAVTPSNELKQEDEALDIFDTLHSDTLVLLEQLTENIIPCDAGSPKLVIQQQSLRPPVPTFDGKVENWPKFRTMFEDIVNRSTDSDAVKLHHLDKALTGDASGWITAKMIVDNNFKQTWKQLSDQYENPRVIVDTHLEGLLEIKPMTTRNHKDLLELVKTFNRHVGGLEYQGLVVDELSGLILTKILTLRLDDQTLQLWERTQKHAQLPQYQETVAFLRSECQVLERFQNRHQMTSREPIQQLNSKPADQKAYTVTTGNTSNSCQVYNGCHRHFECPDFHKLSAAQRYEKVKELRRICFNCLRPGHRSINCSSNKTCSRCHRKHHTLLHEELVSNAVEVETTSQHEEPAYQISSDTRSESQQVTNSVVSCSHSKAAKTVMLMTAVVRIKDSRGWTTPCRVLLDSGSQVNFLSKAMADRLTTKRRPVHIPIVGIGGAKTYAKEKMEVEVESNNFDYSTTIECLVVPKITGAIPATKINVSSWPLDTNLPMADPNFHLPSDIDMLIGISHILQLLKTGRLQLSNKLPELQETHFGWVVADNIGDQSTFQQCLTAITDPTPEVLCQFGQLEEIAESASHSSKQDECETMFQSTHFRDKTGRYVVSLPNCETVHKLGDSRNLAMRRFLSLKQRFKRNTDGYPWKCAQHQSATPTEIPDEDISELKKALKLTAILAINEEELAMFSRFSSFRKPQRVIVPAQRFREFFPAWGDYVRTRTVRSGN